MATRRAVVALRPAVNGLRTSSTSLQQTSTPQICARNFPIHVSRPRKLPRVAHQAVRYASSEAKGEQLGKTGLYELHSKYGAKFVPFGGYSMPVQYSDLGIVESHNWTREKASLFDVGHMYVV